VAALPVTVFAAAAFAHAHRYFFVFDDYCLVGVAGSTGVRTILSTGQIGFYRPLALLLLKAEAALFGWGVPSAYAWTSLLLHFANAALVTAVVRHALPGRPDLAAWSGALFLLSPWAGEAYFWASAQGDLLGTLLALSAVHVALRAVLFRDRLRFVVTTSLAGFLGFAAALSKEAFVTLPGIVVLVLLAVRRSHAPPADGASWRSDRAWPVPRLATCSSARRFWAPWRVPTARTWNSCATPTRFGSSIPSLCRRWTRPWAALRPACESLWRWP